MTARRAVRRLARQFTPTGWLTLAVLGLAVEMLIVQVLS